MKPTSPIRALTFLATLLLAGIFSPHFVGAAETAIVSGKTAYNGMGVEDAEITADDGRQMFRGKSGYHGSFILHLPEGTYELKATLTLPGAGRIGGGVSSFAVPPGVPRLDKVTIEMQPLPGE